MINGISFPLIRVNSSQPVIVSNYKNILYHNLESGLQHSNLVQQPLYSNPEGDANLLDLTAIWWSRQLFGSEFSSYYGNPHVYTLTWNSFPSMISTQMKLTKKKKTQGLVYLEVFLMGLGNNESCCPLRILKCHFFCLENFHNSSFQSSTSYLSICETRWGPTFGQFKKNPKEKFSKFLQKKRAPNNHLFLFTFLAWNKT